MLKSGQRKQNGVITYKYYEEMRLYIMEIQLTNAVL